MELELKKCQSKDWRNKVKLAMKVMKQKKIYKGNGE